MDPAQLSDIINISVDNINILFAVCGIVCGYMTVNVMLTVVWG